MQNLENKIHWVVTVLLLVGVGWLVFAPRELQQTVQQISLGGVTNLDSLTLEDDLIVTDSTTLTSTTTVQEITYGSRFSKALTFTAGATTTPGGLVALQNTGAPKVCRGVPEVELTSQLEGSMNFAFGTSTSATAWSASGSSLISTTTVATGTKPFLGDEPGTYWTVGDEGIASTTVSWSWGAGVYILGAFDKGGAKTGAGTRNNATTTDYTTAAGKLYVTCHTR